MSLQLTALPQGLTGAPLITALNDRLRRISDALSGAASPVAAATGVMYGTHGERISRPVPADSTLYVETDRNSLAYQAQGTQWKYVSGVYRQVQAQLAALILTTNDTGLLVYTTDSQLLYRWTGTAFARQDDFEPTIADTHANRLSNFPSVRYALNQEFRESDRTIRYIAQNAIGTVSVTLGTTVTWVSGHHFINTGSGFNVAQWPAGTQIVIAGAVCTVLSVSSPTVLTLAAATANAAGVVYTVASGRWEYAAGKMQQAWASLPADLGESDVAAAGGGFEFFDRVNSLHIWQWSGSGWTFGPGDRHSGEFAQFDADPGTGWHLCDGAVNQTKYAADGTRVTTFTVPDQRGFYLQASGAYTGAGVVAVAPGLTGLTASGAAVITPLNTASGVANITTSNVPVDSGAGQVVQSGVGVTVAAHTHFHAAPTVTDLGHVHSVAPIDGGHTHGVGTLAVDGTATPPTFAVLPYYRL
jgi:hypothetical protein